MSDQNHYRRVAILLVICGFSFVFAGTGAVTQERDGVMKSPQPHPEMILSPVQVLPSHLYREVSVADANEILMRLDRGPTVADIQAGIAMFNDAFELVSVSTAVLQDLFGVSGLERFNNIAGEIGLVGMFSALSLKVLDEGIDDRDKLELCANLITYASGKWGWQGMQIANIGIFFINYSLTSFGEAAIAGRDAHWKDRYDEYNHTRNPYRMSQQEWNDFVVETALSTSEINTVIDNRVNQYVNAFFSDDWQGGHLCPDNVRSALVEGERARVYENELIIAFERMRDGINEYQQRELMRLMNEARELLNSRMQIRVGVYGDDPDDERVGGLPVRVRVNRDQHLWEGTTNSAGQWWFNLTRYGYLYYDSPLVVELDVEGEPLIQTLQMEPHGDFATVRFYLPEEDEEETEETTEDYEDEESDQSDERLLSIPESILAQVADLRRKHREELGHGRLTRIVPPDNDELIPSPVIFLYLDENRNSVIHFVKSTFSGFTRSDGDEDYWTLFLREASDEKSYTYVWYSNGNMRSEYATKNHRHHGIYREWYSNGQLKVQYQFEDGVLTGPASRYFESGVLEGQGNFEAGVPVGVWYYRRSENDDLSVRDYSSDKRNDSDSDFF